MISHKHQCIFIHIQRCAGTSIETWIAGDDWWNIEPRTKHLLASQAREIYSDVWDRYYKFAIVRRPVERMISCLQHGNPLGLSHDWRNGFSFSRYHELFGSDVVVEHDARFWKREDLLTSRHRSGTVYGNILDEQLDFIGRFENLHEDLKIVAKAIGKSESFNFHRERSMPRFVTPERLSRTDILHIETMFQQDRVQFGYKSMLPI